MNSEQTGKTLLAFSKGANTKSQYLQSLGQTLILGKSKGLESCLSATKIPLGKLPLASCGEAKVEKLVPAISSLGEILVFAGKAGAQNSIKTLEAFVKEHANMSIDSFLSRLSQVYGQPPTQSVDDHVNDLRSTIKDKKKFAQAMSFLKADKTIKVAELRQIATEITGFSQKGPKKSLYAAIEKRHENYFDAINRQIAAGGKSAA